MELSRCHDKLLRGLGILAEIDGLDPARLSKADVCTRLLSAVLQLGTVENASFMFIEPQTHWLRLYMGLSPTEEQVRPTGPENGRKSEFLIGEGIAGRVVGTGHAVCLADAPTHPDYLHKEGAVDVRSLLCLPLECNGVRLGVLNLSHARPHVFTREDEKTLQLVAKRCAACLLPFLETDALHMSAGESAEIPAHPPAAASPENAHPAEHLVFDQQMRALQEIAGATAHTMNNLLTGILGNIEVVLRQDLSGSAHRRLEGARTASLRAAELIRQLLAVSHTARTPFELCNLAEMAAETVAAFSLSFPVTGLIQMKLSPDIPELRVDAEQLSLALRNLCSNAVEAVAHRNGHAAERVPSIVVGLDVAVIDERCPQPWPVPEAGRFIRLYVTDTGGGISPELRGRVCDPFLTSKGPGGVGLGLATVRSIVRRHNGWLHIDSAPSEGTTVSLYLPAGEELVRAEAGRNDGAAQVIETAPKSKAKTILLADDETLICEVGQGILKHLGYHVVCAHDGAEALDTYVRMGDEITVTILDIAMPRLSGPEVLRKIRDLAPEARIVLSSGGGVESGVGLEGKYQPTACLAKPYLINTLADLLKRIVPA